jgi:BirA family transcriptional regulator, biotin operon repressor / biotin---[acetyl-CoA-carboxylase] ligase
MSALGRPRVHLRRTDSTNDRARELAIAGAPHGTLVTASDQTAGRGRQGRRWSAPAGSSLLMSLVLRNPPPLLPLIAAVALCDVAGEEARIKWPNDIVVVRARAPAAIAGGPPGPGAAEPVEEAPVLAKLAGILAEGRPQQDWAVLGIGLNVAVRLTDLPMNLRGGAAAGGGAANRPAATLGEPPQQIEPTLQRLLDALEHRLRAPAETTLEAWRSRDALRGLEIAWATGRGRAEGIDGAGRLVVALPDGGQRTLEAGEVHIEQLG